jgi:hypothetical protein
VVDEKGNEASSLIWWPVLPPGAALQTDSIGRKSLDLTDIPPIPNEEWMPPIKSILYRVLFYYKSARSAQDFWASAAKEWSKDVDHFAEPSKSIRETVAGLIAPATAIWTRQRSSTKRCRPLTTRIIPGKEEHPNLRNSS